MKGTVAALCGVAALLAALLPIPAAPFVGLALAVVTVLLTEPSAFRTSLTLRPLLLAALATALTAAVVTASAGAGRGVAVGGAVFLRLLVLLLITTAASRHLNAETLHALARRLHLPRLGLALGLALNCLPHLAEAWRDAWIALAVRSRRRHPRLSALPRLAETLLAHTARIAEEAAAAAALRGHPALGRPLAGGARMPPVVAVTGRSGTGKTPALLAALAVLQGRGVAVFGFVQPAEVGPEGKSFRLRDVRTLREAPLARRVGPEGGEHGTPFQFDPRGFALARQALAKGPRGGVLVVDEVGPVELRGAGHWPSVCRALRRYQPVALLLGVRRHLLAAFLEELGADTATVVDVTDAVDPAGEVVRAVESLLGPSGS